MKKWVAKNGCVVSRVLSGRSNVYMISSENNHLLVDTSIKSNFRSLCNEIENVRAAGGVLEVLILTHAHYDHVANAADLKEKYKLEVLIQRNDASFIKNGENPIPKGTNRVLKAFTNMLGEKLVPFCKYNPVDYDVVVDNRYDLKSFGINGYIIHTPGHTLGSMSVIVGDEIAIVGDAMVGTFKNSVYPPFAFDIEAMIDSWKILIDTGSTIFLPSHGSENSRELLIKQYKKYTTDS